VKNSRHGGDTDSDRSLFILRFRGLSIKKKTFFPAPYAPPRLKHSRATRELVCRLCAPSSLRPLFDKRAFSLLVSRNESRNEAPSIVQLIFRNFSKKECRRDLALSPLKTHPQVGRKARDAGKRTRERKKIRERQSNRRKKKERIKKS